MRKYFLYIHIDTTKTPADVVGFSFMEQSAYSTMGSWKQAWPFLVATIHAANFEAASQEMKKRLSDTTSSPLGTCEEFNQRAIKEICGG